MCVCVCVDTDVDVDVLGAALGGSLARLPEGLCGRQVPVADLQVLV